MYRLFSLMFFIIGVTSARQSFERFTILELIAIGFAIASAIDTIGYKLDEHYRRMDKVDEQHKED